MQIVVLDPRLVSQRGHYFHADLALSEECKARAIPVEILANRQVVPEVLGQLPARPFFSILADPSDIGSGDPRTDLIEGNVSVQRDLEAGCPVALAPEDLILVPSGRDCHLGGIYRWYTALPEPRPHICLRLIFEPGFGTQNGHHPATAPLVEEQMRGWASLPPAKVSLAAESHTLASFYEARFGIRVTLLPMLIRYPSATATEALPPGSGPHIVFLGEGRREKGFHLLPDALRAVLASHPEVRVTVQTSRRFDIEPAVLRSWRALSPHVSIVRGPLPLHQYEALLLSSDIVLVAYDPAPYALRTSQILIEALATGKVPLTTRETWMAEQLTEMGLADLCVEQFSSDGIAHAILRLLDQWPAAAHRVASVGPRIRQRHNPARFVDTLLRAIG